MSSLSDREAIATSVNQLRDYLFEADFEIVVADAMDDALKNCISTEGALSLTVRMCEISSKGVGQSSGPWHLGQV